MIGFRYMIGSHTKITGVKIGPAQCVVLQSILSHTVLSPLSLSLSLLSECFVDGQLQHDEAGLVYPSVHLSWTSTQILLRDDALVTKSRRRQSKQGKSSNMDIFSTSL